MEKGFQFSRENYDGKIFYRLASGCTRVCFNHRLLSDELGEESDPYGRGEFLLPPPPPYMQPQLQPQPVELI